MTSVAANTAKGKAVHRLIESGTGLLTVHTNGDSAVGGVSDVLADALGLQNVAPLTPATNGLPEEGIGRVGDLPEVLTLGDFAARVFGILPSVAGGVRVSGDPDGLVRRVAVCGGAGDSLFGAVRASNADVYVTADLRHHPASEAREGAVNGRPYLIDVSHFASEWLWLPAAAAALGNVLSDQGHEVDIRVSSTNSDPWDFILTPGGRLESISADKVPGPGRKGTSGGNSGQGSTGGTVEVARIAGTGREAQVPVQPPPGP